jgi:hypothetical protein
MKPKLKELLEESSMELLLEILETLCLKDPKLEPEIEFILNPKKFKYPQSYYNKYAKNAIDTNSWTKFPNKGVAGLERCFSKVQFFESIGNFEEAAKLAKAIIDIIKRCKKKYNNQNVDELKSLERRLAKYWY